MEKYDIVIVGAGPAGLSAAKILAEKRRKVLVLEKNIKIGHKICGGGLTTKDFGMGVPESLADKTFNNAVLNTPLARDTIKAKRPYVATVQREKLGEFMASVAREKGAEIKTDTEVAMIDNHKITTSSGQVFSFDYLIGADGSNSIVRKYLKIPVEKKMLAFQYLVPKKFKNMEFFFNAKLFNTGYAWIFPFNNFTSIGCGVGSQYDITVLQQNFHQLLKKLAIDVKGLKMQGWIINYDYRGYEFDNIFLAGDAAGFASGFTGEGIYFACVSGQEIARKILDSSYKTQKIEEILKIKNLHEKYLDKLNKSSWRAHTSFILGGLLFKTGLYDQKLIDLFG